MLSRLESTAPVYEFFNTSVEIPGPVETTLCAMCARWALVAAALFALLPISGGAAGTAWEQWTTVPGIFDLGGPRTDGSFVVAGSAALYLANPAGQITRFARGSNGYHDDATAEAYLDVSPGLHVASAGCDFAPDDTLLLRLHAPIGITRVDAAGQSSPFANIGTSTLNGIAFDQAGAFDHRLLVTAPVNGKTEIVAVDCTGAVKVLTRSAPVMEGGLAVAPASFGAFGGSLIAPDELSGLIYAIAANGSTRLVVNSGLPHGPDTGVESVAFVPPGFSRGGAVFYSDRGTPGNPHAGTDSLLWLPSASLVSAGVQDGDLLAATEGGATMIAVHCDTSCHVISVVGTPSTAHGEGHLVFTLNKVESPNPVSAPRVASPSPIPTGGGRSTPLVIGVAILLAAALAVALAASRRGAR